MKTCDCGNRALFTDGLCGPCASLATTLEDTGHEGIGSSRGTKRRYNPAVGCWTAVYEVNSPIKKAGEA